MLGVGDVDGVGGLRWQGEAAIGLLRPAGGKQSVGPCGLGLSDEGVFELGDRVALLAGRGIQGLLRGLGVARCVLQGPGLGSDGIILNTQA